MSFLDIKDIEQIIKKCDWTWAKTYVTCPHEYIMRKSSKHPMNDLQFSNFIRQIRRDGVKEWFGRNLNYYLYVDGYKYWTMGDGIDIDNDNTINRQKIFKEFDNLKVPNPSYYTDKTAGIVNLLIKQIGVSKYYEIGCGDGLFVQKYLDVGKDGYRGVEPSNKLVYQFRVNNPHLSRNIVNRSFEESFDRWEKYNDTHILLALFGTASYIMRPYLEKVANSGKKFFLMFYKDGFVPTEFKDMHHFMYNSVILERMFRKSYKYSSKDYYIVSSDRLDIAKAILEYDYEHPRGLFD